MAGGIHSSILALITAGARLYCDDVEEALQARMYTTTYDQTPKYVDKNLKQAS